MRRSERLPVELVVTWRRAGRSIPCVVVDVNAHGLFVRSDEIVELGSLMHLCVELPGRAIEMFATARFVGHSVSGRGIGAEILLIDDVGQRHWYALYERLCVADAQRKSAASPG